MCIIDSIISNSIIVHYRVHVFAHDIAIVHSVFFFFNVDCHLCQVIFILECKPDIVIGAKVFIANDRVVRLLLPLFK